MSEVPGGKDLMDVEEVARRLGLVPATVWRWCREGRLPCVKIGRSWRIRAEALEDFIRRSERPVTLEGELGAFLRVPDNMLAIAQNPKLLHRLDAAYLKVAEARDGLLVKFYGGDTVSGNELRARLAGGGLDVERLEREGRFYLEAEHGSSADRVKELRQVLSGKAGAGRTVWAAFDWAGQMDLETAFRQQRALTEVIGSGQLVVMTALLEDVTDGWPSAAMRKAQTSHSGTIWLSEDGVALSRMRRIPGI